MKASVSVNVTPKPLASKISAYSYQANEGTMKGPQDPNVHLIDKRELGKWIEKN